MSTQELYNLSPALQLMLMGLAVAMGPLVWIWLRSRHTSGAQRLRALTLVTLFLTFDLVIFGAFTRLTDSGLGCPDWPGCYGHASPVGAQLHIEAAQEAMPSGPVTHPKAWVEMIHRYLATGVGVMILTLAIASVLERRRVRANSSKLPPEDVDIRWPLLTLFWVCLQGAFGALTVTMKLFPAIVTMHLLGGLILLALLKVQTVRHSPAGDHATATPSLGLYRFALATFALLWLQIALGGWVSTNYAVLACSEFPGCQGSLWPVMDFHHGFTIWRALGSDGHDGNISFQALTAIHYVHRLSAYIVFAALLALAFKLNSVPVLRRQARRLAGLALLQVATGLGNVLLGWPLAAAVLHTGGAAALVIVLTGVVFSGRREVAHSAAAHQSKWGASSLSA
jgi:cytochrome c oxidase assembly protein subunit 15